ncbi:MAG: ATP-binding protein [Tenuifilaceae bacterium]|jgi:two-component system phosphate regulon sensor histidine kinase PhoR|nr:ATP-binding protein [Tenuifilaceae bacterium]
MKITSSKTLAVVISLIAAGAFIIAGVILYRIGFNASGWHIAGFALAIFLGMYLVVQNLLNLFIFEKIHPVYKTIQNLMVSDEELKKNLAGKDLIGEVNNEVVVWADNKSREIDRLKELEDYRKEFLGNVSHELKTPIFNIQGYILTLLDGALEDPTINRKYLERTEKSINRLISIVEDLESISKLESKVLALDTDRFNLVQLVQEVFDSQEIRARKRGIKLGFDQEYSEPLWVVADKKRIFQALANLVANSINYGKEGGRTVVSFMDMNENILVEVNDNGIGIPKEDIPRIFERFYRVDKSRSRDQGGTGLGLAIVKHIIEAHNQTINVRSSKNEGTSFVFTIKKSKHKKSTL